MRALGSSSGPRGMAGASKSMLGSDLKLLPHVRLHPSHHAPKQGSGSSGSSIALEPLQAASSARECQKQNLGKLLKEVVSFEADRVDEQEALESPPFQVFLSSTSMVIDSGHELVEIPLLLTDVVEAALPRKQGASFVVALAPSPGPAGSVQEASQCPVQSQQKPLQPRSQDVWVFTVGGTALDLKSLLFDLGGRGALRWDLYECYTLAKKPLGEGAGGKVFLGQSTIAKHSEGAQQNSAETAIDVLRIDRVAVKILNQGKTKDWVRREIDFLAKARGHPNITVLYGAFCDNDASKDGQENRDEVHERNSQQDVGVSWFIVMELCSSSDLFDYLLERTMDSSECHALMEGLSSALDHLHTLGIVHRDVKPENILMGPQSQPILADMGIATYLDDAEEMAKTRGSVGYLAPQMAAKKPYNELVDVFAAGCVYYHALSGHKPFRGCDELDILERTAQCRVSYPDRWFYRVSTGIMNVMTRCLSKDPQQRPCARTCLELLVKLANGGLVEHPGSQSSPARLDPFESSLDTPSQTCHCRQPEAPPRGLSHVVAAPGDASSSSSAAIPLVRTPARPEIAEPSSSTGRPSSSAKAGPTAMRAEVPAAMRSNGAMARHEAANVASSMLLPSRLHQRPSQSRPPRSPPKDEGLVKNNGEQYGEVADRSAEPAEQQTATRRHRSVPSRIQQSLCSMSHIASHWIAASFQKSSRPAVDGPGTGASSRSASSRHSNTGAIEFTPIPPSSAPPPKQSFRSFAFRRP